MPAYEVVAPDGRKFRIDGAEPPDQDTLDEIFTPQDERAFDTETPTIRNAPFKALPPGESHGKTWEEEMSEDMEKKGGAWATVGEGFDILGRALFAAPVEAGKVMFRPLTDQLYPEQAEPGVMEGAGENFRAIGEATPMPGEEARVLGKWGQGAVAGAHGLIHGAPKMAAIAGIYPPGLAAEAGPTISAFVHPLVAGTVFGATPQGFSGTEATIGATLPFIGRLSGGAVGMIAKRLGFKDNITALNWMKGIGGTVGPGAAMLAHGEHEISKLPAEQQEQARVQLWGNIAAQVGTGPMGVKYERRPGERSHVQFDPLYRGEVRPLSEAEVIASERAAIDAGDAIGSKVELVDQAVGAGDDPFAPGEYAKPTATGMKIQRAGLQRRLAEIAPEDRAEFLKTLVTHEHVHRHISNKEAVEYQRSLSWIERAINRRIYTSKWTKEGLSELFPAGKAPPDFSDAQLGHEAIRRRIEKLSGSSTEAIQSARLEKWTVKNLEFIADKIREAREGFRGGTEASKRGVALLNTLEKNLKAAKSAVSPEAGDQPAAFDAGEEAGGKTPRQQYDELVARFKAAPVAEKFALQGQIEALKNKHGGMPPTAEERPAAFANAEMPTADELLALKPEETSPWLKQIKYGMHHSGEWAKTMNAGEIEKLHTESQRMREDSSSQMAEAAKAKAAGKDEKHVDAMLSKALQSSLKSQTLREIVEDYKAMHEEQPAAFDPLSREGEAEQRKFDKQWMAGRALKAFGKRHDDLTDEAIDLTEQLTPEEIALVNDDPQIQNLELGEYEFEQLPPTVKELYRVNQKLAELQADPRMDLIDRINEQGDTGLPRFGPGVRPSAFGIPQDLPFGEPGKKEGGKEPVLPTGPKKLGQLGLTLTPPAKGEEQKQKPLPTLGQQGLALTAGGAKPSATELGATRRLTAGELEKAGAAHMQAETERMLAQFKAGKKVKATSFPDFAKAMKLSYPEIKPGQLLEAYEKAVHNELMRASGEELQAIANAFKVKVNQVADAPEAPGMKLEQEGGTKEGKIALRDKAQIIAKRQRYRNSVISRIAERVLLRAMPPAEIRARTSITPDELAPVIENMEGDLVPTFQDFDAQDLNPALVGKLEETLANGNRRSLKDSITVTKRVTAILDPKTGKVHLVSTYEKPRTLNPDGSVKTPAQIMMVDPSLTVAKAHRPLAEIQKKYRLLSTMLLDEPVQTFKQTFDSLSHWENAFGTDARTAGLHTTYEPIATENEFQGRKLTEEEMGHLRGARIATPGVYQDKPGLLTSKKPMTEQEAMGILGHITDEVGVFAEAADVMDSITALREGDTSPTALLALSGYRKLFKELERQHPNDSTEQLLERLANKLYDIQSQTGDNPEAFSKRAVAEAGAPAGEDVAGRPAAPALPAEAAEREPPTFQPGLKRPPFKALARFPEKFPTPRVQGRLSGAERLQVEASAKAEYPYEPPKEVSPASAARGISQFARGERQPPTGIYRFRRPPKVLRGTIEAKAPNPDRPAAFSPGELIKAKLDPETARGLWGVAARAWRSGKDWKEGVDEGLQYLKHNKANVDKGEIFHFLSTVADREGALRWIGARDVGEIWHEYERRGSGYQATKNLIGLAKELIADNPQLKDKILSESTYAYDQPQITQDELAQRLASKIEIATNEKTSVYLTENDKALIETVFALEPELKHLADLWNADPNDNLRNFALGKLHEGGFVSEHAEQALSDWGEIRDRVWAEDPALATFIETGVKPGSTGLRESKIERPAAFDPYKAQEETGIGKEEYDYLRAIVETEHSPYNKDSVRDDIIEELSTELKRHGQRFQRDADYKELSGDAERWVAGDPKALDKYEATVGPEFLDEVKRDAFTNAHRYGEKIKEQDDRIVAAREALQKKSERPAAFSPLVQEVQRAADTVKDFVSKRGLIADLGKTLDESENAPRIKARQKGAEIRHASADKARRSLLKDWTQGQEPVLHAANAVVEAEFDRSKLAVFQSQLRQAKRHFRRMAASGDWREKRIAAAYLRDIKASEAEVNYADANWNKPELQQTAQRVKASLDELRAFRIANGKEVNELPGYVPHRLLDVWAGAGSLYQIPGVMGHNYKAPRVFKTHYEALAAGPYMRATHDVATLVENAWSKGLGEIAGEQWKQGLKAITMPDGLPMAVDPKMVNNKPLPPSANYEVVDLGNHEWMAVHKGIVKDVKNLTNPDWFQTAPLMGAALRLEQGLKHSILIGDLFHYFRTGYFAASNIGKQAFGLGKSGWSVLDIAERNVPEALRKGIISQKDVDWANHRINGITRRQIVEMAYERHGANLGRISDALYKDLASETTPTSGIVRRGIAKVAEPTVGRWNKFLFDKMTRGLMAESIVRQFEKQWQKNPTLSPDALLRDVVRDINERFGNLGRQGFFKGKTAQSWARLLFLAPQWVEGLARTEARAYGRLTGASKLLGQRKGVTALGATGASVGKAMVFMLGLTQAINLLTRGQSTFQNEDGHKLDAWIPSWGSEEEGFWFSPLSVFMELSHDAIRLVEAKLDRDQNAGDALTHILSNKQSPVARAVGVALGGRTPMGERITSTTGRFVTEPLKAMAPVPITFGKYLQAGGHAMAPSIVPPVPPGQMQRQTAGSLGVKIEPASSKVSRMSVLADKFMREEGLEKETGWEQVQNDEASYTKLRRAIRNKDDADARRLYDRLLVKRTPGQITKAMKMSSRLPFTGSNKAEKAFRASLDDKQYQDYQDAKMQKLEEYEEFVAWLSRQED